MERDCDVLVCGASFAGLAVARELAGTGARVLVIDRYEIGERQTSACAIPTAWLAALELMDSAAPDLRRAGRAHALPHGALVAAVVVLDVRLPRAVRAAVARRPTVGDARVRDRDRDRARAATRSTPTAASCARR